MEVIAGRYLYVGFCTQVIRNKRGTFMGLSVYCSLGEMSKMDYE